MADKLDREAIDVRFGALDQDVSDIKKAVVSLNTKIDEGLKTIASEFRAALSERKQPVATYISGVAFVVAILGAFGNQALIPMQRDINEVRSVIVPRAEHVKDWDAQARRDARVDEAMRRLTDAEVATRRDLDFLKGQLSTVLPGKVTQQ